MNVDADVIVYVGTNEKGYKRLEEVMTSYKR